MVVVVVDCVHIGTAEKMATVAIVLGFGDPRMTIELISMG
jgi:hypothetical protein